MAPSPLEDDPTPSSDSTAATFAVEPRLRHEREDVEFRSAGVRCAAWLYRPAGVDGPAPLVVMAHGLGGTRHMRLDAYARRFADAGIAALVFDYRHSGDSDGSPRQLVDIGRQLADWHAALAFARTLPDVDHARIAIWGTSFGGGHVMRIGAEDQGVVAVVSQCPFTDGVASVLARMRSGVLSSTVLFAAGIVDTIGGLLRLPALQVGMAGTRWMPAYMVAPDCVSGASGLMQPGTVVSTRTSRLLRGRLRKAGGQLATGIELAPEPGTTAPAALASAATPPVVPAKDTIWGVLRQPDGSEVVNALPARLAVRLSFYRPRRDLKRLGTRPALVCVCDGDSVAPPGPTLRAAEGLDHVRAIRYPYNHFSIYVGDAFERAVADQLAFLAEHLRPGS